MARRIKRFDLYLTQNFSVSDARQIAAASAVAKVYKQGATANGSGSIAATASGNVTVRHPGNIIVGDTVVVGTGSATATVNTVAATTINVTAGGSTFAWADGARIVVTSARPSTYVESTANVATAVASQATADSVGHAFFYAEEESFDILYSTDSFVTASPLYDVDGIGGNVFLSNEIDSATAVGFLFKMKRALSTSGAKILSMLNSAGTELFGVDKAGILSGVTGLPANLVDTAAIQNLAVTTAKIAALAVTTAKIDALAVTAAELATGAVTTAKLATAAAVNAPAQGVNASNQTISSGTYGDVTGCSVTLTPDSTGSVLFIIGTCNVRYLGGTAGQAFLAIHDGSTQVDEKAQVLTASTDNPGCLTCMYRVTGLSGSKTFKLQSKEAGGLSSFQIDGSSPNFARIQVIEFKKAV